MTLEEAFTGAVTDVLLTLFSAFNSGTPSGASMRPATAGGEDTAGVTGATTVCANTALLATLNSQTANNLEKAKRHLGEALMMN